MHFPQRQLNLTFGRFLEDVRMVLDEDCHSLECRWQHFGFLLNDGGDFPAQYGGEAQGYLVAEVTVGGLFGVEVRLS